MVATLTVVQALQCRRQQPFTQQLQGTRAERAMRATTFPATQESGGAEARKRRGQSFEMIERRLAEQRAHQFGIDSADIVNVSHTPQRLFQLVQIGELIERR